AFDGTFPKCKRFDRYCVGAIHCAQALAQQPAADQFIATFRCEDNGIVGTTDAKIHSVTRHDDGRIEVVIDHWPKQPAARGDVLGLVTLAEQWERDAGGCRRDGYMDAAVVKENCAF